jgi:hypothetical protein
MTPTTSTPSVRSVSRATSRSPACTATPSGTPRTGSRRE